MMLIRFLSCKYLLLLLLCSLQWGCYTHPSPRPDTDWDFETKLYQFKHELYPLFIVPQPQDSANFHALSKEVTDKVDAFLAANDHNLRRHWVNHLRKIGRFQIDLSEFKEMPLPPNPVTDALPPQVMRLRDPVSQMYILISLTLVHHLQLSSSQIHTFYLRAQLGSPLFQTAPGKNDSWLILADFYTHAFGFVYEPASGHVELKHLYRRKSQDR